jgi:hypothetical protein
MRPNKIIMFPMEDQLESSLLNAFNHKNVISAYREIWAKLLIIRLSNNPLFGIDPPGIDDMQSISKMPSRASIEYL